jgi:hypothetical protein
MRRWQINPKEAMTLGRIIEAPGDKVTAQPASIIRATVGLYAPSVMTSVAL